MEEKKDIEWFNRSIAPDLKNFEIKYRFFAEGDFGALNQIEFNSKLVGGNIDFCGLGWLGIFVRDYKNEKIMLNILLEPQQEKEKTEAFEKLNRLLK